MSLKCEYIKKCGGCDYCDIEYQDHLNKKKNKVESIFKGIAIVNSITGMENPFHYRNKVHAAFGIKNKKVVHGTYKKNSHEIISHKNCFIENKKSDKIIETIARLFKEFKIKIYDEDTGFGLVRHVLIRNGIKTGEYLVVIVCTDVIFPAKNNFVKALLKEHKEITSIAINVNDRKTSQILGKRNIVIYGKGYIEDKIFDNIYRISANSFYQVNSYMVEKLYGKAIEKAAINKNDIVLDLYCGIGTIGISVAKTARIILGVEINNDAFKDAILNVKINKLKNVRIVNEDAKVFMKEVIAEEKMLKNKTKVSVAFIDPPREGCDKEFVDLLMILHPEKIVYISCNPETLYRDLKIFKKKYNIGKIDLFDMFPWTSHVECVVLLSAI